jgi:hypothetical protein
MNEQSRVSGRTGGSFIPAVQASQSPKLQNVFGFIIFN